MDGPVPTPLMAATEMNSTEVQNPRQNSMQALDAGIMQIALYVLVRKMIL